VFGGFIQQVAFAPDPTHQRHHQVFAKWIDGRVGDLGEELLEVRKQQLRLVRQHGQCGIIPHGAHGFLAVRRHGTDDHTQFLPRVAEGMLLAQERSGILGRDDRRRQQAAQLDAILRHPAAIGALPGHLRLDLVVRHDALLLEVHQQHLARTQSAAPNSAAGGHFQSAGLRGQHNQPLYRDQVARRTQAVPVQCGTDVTPVREDQCRRAVPWLHDGRVVFVEGPLVLAHVEPRSPGLRDHHAHRVRQGPSSSGQQLQHVVHDGRIAAPLDDDRPDLLNVVAE